MEDNKLQNTEAIVDETIQDAEEACANAEEQSKSDSENSNQETYAEEGRAVQETNSNNSYAPSYNSNDKKQDNNNKNKKDSPDLKSLSVMTAELCYAYSLALADRGHRLLATEITRFSLDNDYYASFVSGALSKDKFAKSLEQGFYTTGKLYEVLSMVAALGLKQDKHDQIMDMVDRMHRMYAASLRTFQKKITVPQHVSGF